MPRLGGAFGADAEIRNIPGDYVRLEEQKLTDERKLSEIIAEFLKLTDSARASYEYFSGEMDKQEQLTQDILHKFETENLKYGERAKWGAELAKTRQSRRAVKDCVGELAPIVDFAEKNKGTLNALKRTLGEVRKEERYHEKRRYFPRILKDEGKE